MQLAWKKNKLHTHFSQVVSVFISHTKFKSSNKKSLLEKEANELYIPIKALCLNNTFSQIKIYFPMIYVNGCKFLLSSLKTICACCLLE